MLYNRKRFFFIINLFINIFISSSAFSLDIDTLVLKSGKVLTGIIHHKNQKFLKLSQFKSLKHSNDISYHINLDSISSIKIDTLNSKHRYFLELGKEIDWSDSNKTVLLNNTKLSDIKKYYNVSLSIDLISFANLTPYVSLELFRQRSKDISLVILGSMKLINRKSIFNNSRNYLLGIGLKKYFNTSNLGSFYFSPQIFVVNYDYDTYFFENIKQTGSITGYVSESNGFSFSNNIGYCFYKKGKYLLNIEAGIGVIKTQSVPLKIWIKNGIEIGRVW